MSASSSCQSDSSNEVQISAAAVAKIIDSAYPLTTLERRIPLGIQSKGREHSMKVFISWSGPRSHAIAVALHEWLPNVLQAVEPWMSSVDIDKGSRWAEEIATRLGEVDFGIICLSPENQHAPWLLFEAGALSKSIATSAVATLLLALRPADVSGPLSQFQHTEMNRDDIEKLLFSINQRMHTPLAEQKLHSAFELWWPQLSSQIEGAIALKEVPAPHRNEREILEEILLQSRAQSRLLRESRFVDWLEDFARALKGVPLELPMRFAAPASSAHLAEKVLSGTLCPFHEQYLAVQSRDSDDLGNVIFTVKGCCNFVMRLAYESVKSL